MSLPTWQDGDSNSGFSWLWNARKAEQDFNFGGGHEVGVGGAKVRKSPLKFSLSLLLFLEFGSELDAEQDGTSLQIMQKWMVRQNKICNYNVVDKWLNMNNLKVEFPASELNPLPLPDEVVAFVLISAKGCNL